MERFQIYAVFLTCLISLVTFGHCEYVRGCYYTNWAQYRDGKGKFVPENYTSGLCTHIFYAFAGMNADFTIKAIEFNDESSSGTKGMYERVNDLKKQQPGLKTLLSFGGGTFTQNNQKLMSTMLASADNRKTFTQSVISFVRKNNFDGFDMDYEYPTAADKSDFATFMKEMRAAFEQEGTSSGKPRLLLTAAVAAGIQNIDPGYDVPALGSALDYVNVMTYDYHGTWEQVTGMNSPLYDRNGDKLSMSTTVNYWIEKGAPKEKILVGLAPYGRGWTLTDAANSQIGASTSGPSPAQPFTKEAGIGAYYEICDLLVNGGARAFFDDTQKVPYMVRDTLWFGYDDAKSFQEKLNWIKSNGFGGAFTWTLDFDDFQGQCASSNGQKFPLHKLIADSLSGGGPKERTTKATHTRTTTKHSVTATTAKPSGAFNCLTAGIFPNLRDCSTFYSCDAGLVAHKMDCPAGLLFNRKTSNCDWPQNVDQCQQ